MAVYDIQLDLFIHHINSHSILDTPKDIITTVNQIPLLKDQSRTSLGEESNSIVCIVSVHERRSTPKESIFIAWVILIILWL